MRAWGAWPAGLPYATYRLPKGLALKALRMQGDCNVRASVGKVLGHCWQLPSASVAAG